MVKRKREAGVAMGGNASGVQDTGLFELRAVTLAGVEAKIHIAPTATVADAQTRFAGSLGIDLSQCTVKLIHGGQTLARRSILNDCGIEPGAVLSIVTSLSRWQARLDPEILQIEGADHGTFSLDAPMNQAFMRGLPSLKLQMDYSYGHDWTSARLDVPEHVGGIADCMSAFMKMDRLQANGAYCNVWLGHGDRQESLEVKFDQARLRGYGSCTLEDFGIPVRGVRAGEWLHLFVVFDKENNSATFLVNDEVIKRIRLKDKPWDRIAAVELKGYAKRTIQWWGSIVVGLYDDLV